MVLACFQLQPSLPSPQSDLWALARGIQHYRATRRTKQPAHSCLIYSRYGVTSSPDLEMCWYTGNNTHQLTQIVLGRKRHSTCMILQPERYASCNSTVPHYSTSCKDLSPVPVSVEHGNQPLIIGIWKQETGANKAEMTKLTSTMNETGIRIANRRLNNTNLNSFLITHGKRDRRKNNSESTYYGPGSMFSTFPYCKTIYIKIRLVFPAISRLRRQPFRYFQPSK